MVCHTLATYLGELDDLSAAEAEFLVIIEHRVHVLNPDSVHRSVEHVPALLIGHRRSTDTYQRRQDAVCPAHTQNVLQVGPSLAVSAPARCRLSCTHTERVASRPVTGCINAGKMPSVLHTQNVLQVGPSLAVSAPAEGRLSYTHTQNVLQVGPSLADGGPLATPHRQQIGVASTTAIGTYDSCCVSDGCKRQLLTQHAGGNRRSSNTK